MGGLTSLLLLLCVGVTLSAVLDLQKRIWGGQTCGPNERLYHVRLIINDGSRNFLCGGSLINESWILTAGHCSQNGWTIRADLGVHPGPLPGNPGVQETMQIRELPERFTDNQNRIHDIMLLQLPNPTQVNHIIPLPNCGQQPPLGDEVQVAGHGPTNRSSNISSPTLQCANLTKVDCTGITRNHPDPDQYLFCGSNPTRGTCHGDSGGGVVYKGQIYGVHRSSDAVNCDRISSFVNVCEYMDWIQRITGIQAP